MTKRKPPEEHKRPGPKLKWTEEAAIALGEELITWQKADTANIYWQRFLLLEKDLYASVIHYLIGQYPRFSKLIKDAEAIQELRLMEKEGKGEIKSMFVLKNKHGWADKQDIKSQSTVHQTVKDVSEVRQMSEEDLKERLRWLTESPSKH